MNDESAFDPLKFRSLEMPQLEHILKGHVKNPDPSFEHSFFVAKDIPYSDQLAGLRDYMTLLDKCDWYAKFSCHGNSGIVIPGRYLIHVHTRNRQLLVDEYRDNPWWDGGFFQEDRDETARLISTKIDTTSLLQAIRKYYGRYGSGQLDKLVGIST